MSDEKLAQISDVNQLNQKAPIDVPNPAPGNDPSGAAVVTDVNTATNEITIAPAQPESKAPESVMPKRNLPPPHPSEHPFVASTRKLLDHFQAEPKHSLLQNLLDDCEREYRNLIAEFDKIFHAGE